MKWELEDLYGLKLELARARKDGGVRLRGEIWRGGVDCSTEIR